MKGYNQLAPVYDRLARFVFGKAMTQSQMIFLGQLQNCESVLVLGGGTGWWLNDLLKRFPDLKITFVDSSSEMIRRAKMKLKLKHQVDFVHGTIEDVSMDRKFDGVILYYFLDLFPGDRLPVVIEKIFNHMNANSIWLVSDFINRKKWHTAFLKMMYLFFYLLTGSTSKQLPDWQNKLENAGLLKIEEQTFYGKFILAGFYISDKL